MAILIIGSPEEQHAAFIYQKIMERGEEAVYLNTWDFPAKSRLSLLPDSKALGFFSASEQEKKIPLTDFRSVYWRYHFGYQLPALNDQFLLDMAYREIESTVGSMLRMLPCRMVNSPEAIAMHAYKTYQLQLLKQAGLRVPQTLVTNDPDAVLEFYERLQGQVIFKPVRGGAHTEKLKPEDLKAERLKELSKAPVQFQELIEGVDVRVYWMGQEAFSAEIRSKTLDFRADAEAEIVPVELPGTIQQQCHIVCNTLGLLYSGIDIRRTPAGEYVFLEGNPCPMFIHFEKQTGYPISNRLVDLLMEQ